MKIVNKQEARVRAMHARGFTLVELMAVTLIIALLSAIAWPAYQRYVVRAHRNEAQSALLALAQSMERQFAQRGTYAGLASAGADTGAPAFFATQSPLDGGQKTYDLSIFSASATSYTLQARPIAGTLQANDGLMRLSSTGVRSWDVNNDGSISTAEQTWAGH